MGEKPTSFLDIKIVIVDDLADLRFLIAKFLAERGAQVFAAKNASEGLRLVREILPDVVVSDINMPGRSGLDLLVDIHALGRDIPVIAMTAYGYNRDLIKELGFEGHLYKPFAPDQLLASIDLALRR